MSTNPYAFMTQGELEYVAETVADAADKAPHETSRDWFIGGLFEVAQEMNRRHDTERMFQLGHLLNYADDYADDYRMYIRDARWEFAHLALTDLTDVAFQLNALLP